MAASESGSTFKSFADRAILRQSWRSFDVDPADHAAPGIEREASAAWLRGRGRFVLELLELVGIAVRIAPSGALDDFDADAQALHAGAQRRRIDGEVTALEQEPRVFEQMAHDGRESVTFVGTPV